MALSDAFSAPWLCSGRLACPGGEAEAIIASSPFFKSDVGDLVGLLAGLWSFAWTDVPATSSNRARLAGRAFTTPLLPEPPTQALDCSIPPGESALPPAEIYVLELTMRCRLERLTGMRL